MNYNINGIILPVNIDVNNRYKIVHSYGNIKALNGKFSINRNGVAINFIPKSVTFHYNYIEVDFGSYFIYITDVIYYSFGAFEYTSEDLYRTVDFSGQIFISKNSDFSAYTEITGGIHPPNVVVESDNIEFNVFSSEKNPHLYWEKPEQEYSEITGYYYNFSQDANYVVGLEDDFTDAKEIILNVPNSGVWYFHIKAINSFGNFSKQITTVCIKYNNIPSIPSNLLVNGYSSYNGYTSSNLFSWDESVDSDSDFFQYYIELYDDSESDSLIYSSVLQENYLTYPVNQLDFFNPGTYRYRVRAFDEYQTSDWSNFCEFTISSLKIDAFKASIYAAHVPPSPIITSNVEDDVWTEINMITFNWTSENDRVEIGKYIYKFEFCKFFDSDQEVSDSKIYDSGENLVTSKRYNLNSFDGSCIYKLTVKAQGVSGLISDPSTFYIKYNHTPTVPLSPLLINNINTITKTGYVGLNYYNVFSWGRSSDYDGDIIYYEVQVSKNPNFENIFYEKRYITDDNRANYSFYNGAIKYENDIPDVFYSYEEIKNVANWSRGPIIDESAYPINASWEYYSLMNTKKIAYIYIGNPGYYQFGIRSGGYGAFRVDNKTYFSTLNESLTHCFTIYLSEGYHYIENYYNNYNRGYSSTRIYWKTPTSEDWSYIPKSVLFYCKDADGNYIDDSSLYKYIHSLINSSDSSLLNENESNENFEFSFNIDYDNSYSGLYYWKVRAYDMKQYSAWSSIGKFKLNTPPSVPTNLVVTY